MAVYRRNMHSKTEGKCSNDSNSEDDSLLRWLTEEECIWLNEYKMGSAYNIHFGVEQNGIFC